MNALTETNNELIRRIKSIKKFGIFDNYSIGTLPACPEFRKYNIVYGWNGSGKTTLGKVLACYDRRKADDKYNDAEFSLLVGKESYDNSSLNDFPYTVRVFNKDYVERNIQFSIEKIGGIVRTGEKNIELESEIKKLEEQSTKINERLPHFEKSFKTASSKLDEFYKTLGAVIHEAINKDRTYNAGNCKKDYDKNFDENNILDEIVLREIKKIAQTKETKPSISYISLQLNSFPDLKLITEALSYQLLTLGTLDKLLNNHDLQEWVKQGLKLHENETECQFCENKLSADRTARMKSHFNDDRGNLETKLALRKDSWVKFKEQIIGNPYPDFTDFFSDEEFNYLKIRTTKHEPLKIKLGKLADAVLGAIGKKQSSLYNVVNLKEELIKYHISRRELITIRKDVLELDVEIKNLIDTHNNRVANFQSHKNTAIEKIIAHYLVTNVSDKNEIIKNLEKEQIAYEAQKLEINEINKKIIDAKSKFSDIGIAAKAINEDLNTFFGNDTISLEVSSNGGEEHYILKRDGRGSSTLSEGEKNTIALIYFLNDLRAGDKKIEDIIVVLDDPISSLDYKNFYNAISFIEKRLAKPKQLIILTHNYLFFCEICRWFKSINKQMFYLQKNQTTEIKTNSVKFVEYFQIKKHSKNESRLTEMDTILKDYSSEYHYYFSKLIESRIIRNSNEIQREEEKLALINMCRKVLEVFTSFKYVCKDSDTLHKKLNAFTDISGEEKGWLCRLVNIGSHATIRHMGEESLNIVQHVDECVDAVLNIIEKADPVHYESMAGLSSSDK